MNETPNMLVGRYPLDCPSWLKRFPGNGDVTVEFGDCVYLIQMGNTRYYKIGHSVDPRRRLFSLQTGNPLPLKIRWIIKSPEAEKLEAWFHRKFGNRQTEAGNEWFILPDAAITWIKGFSAFREPSYDELVELQYRYAKLTPEDIGTIKQRA